MRLLAVTAGTMLATVATFASADYDARVDPYYAPGIPAHQECWNPSAGHYETVRGGPQGDLDFRNCRVVRDDGYASGYTAPPPVYAAPPAYAAAPAWRGGRQECWNPGSGHYEEVRGGYQGDLDYSRCRMIGGDDRYTYAPAYRARQECWNPRAGHYEEVRGGYQGDLDYRRCRVIG